MVLVLRGLSRLLAAVLLAALALLGLATAIFSIQGDSGTLSLPTLARHFQLHALRGVVGGWLGRLEDPGPTAWISIGGGVAAVALGLLLLVGILVRRRERLLLVEEDEQGRLLARRRPLGQIASALAERERGVTDTKARVRARRRRRGGRLRLRATHVQSVSHGEVEARIAEAISPLAESFELKARIRPRTGKARVS